MRKLPYTRIGYMSDNICKRDIYESAQVVRDPAIVFFGRCESNRIIFFLVHASYYLSTFLYTIEDFFFARGCLLRGGCLSASGIF